MIVAPTLRGLAAPRCKPGKSLVTALLAGCLGAMAVGPAEARADVTRSPRGPVQIAEISPTKGRSSKAVEHYRAQRYLQARAAANVALRGNRSNLAALSILGWSEYQLGRYGAARRAFARFVELAPRSSDAQIGLGWSLFKLGRLAESRRHFLAAQPYAVGDQRYIVADGLGWIAFTERKFDEATRHFCAEKEQRARGKIQHDGALGAAWVAMARGKYRAAMRTLLDAIKQQPRYFRLHDAIGRAARGEAPHLLQSAARRPRAGHPAQLRAGSARRGTAAA